MLYILNRNVEELTMEQSMKVPKWIDEKEVSRITGIAIQTLRNWRCRRVGFPYSKGPGGRMVRYLLDDVVRIMKERRVNLQE
jgi:phage terminase Nu1 subunit (DNA packaging protein)